MDSLLHIRLSQQFRIVLLFFCCSQVNRVQRPPHQVERAVMMMRMTIPRRQLWRRGPSTQNQWVMTVFVEQLRFGFVSSNISIPALCQVHTRSVIDLLPAPDADSKAADRQKKKGGKMTDEEIMEKLSK